MNHEPMKPSFNVAAELLEQNAVDRGDKVAIYCGDDSVTYRQVLTNVNKFANILAEFGIKPGERVVIHLPDSPMFVYAFLGSIKHGAWPIPVNTMLGVGDYEYILDDSEARGLVTHQTSAAAQAKSDHLCCRLFADNGLADRLARAPEDAETHSAQADDIAFWLYSSGSTGRPKGTPHKQIDMLFTAQSYGRHVVKIKEEDLVFSVSKLFFAYGLGNSISMPFSQGAATVLLSDAPTPEKVMDAIEKHQPTLFFGVPTQYNSLLKKMDGARFPSIRACFSAGEALPPEIFRQWKDRTGQTILDGIGSTEALHIYISNQDQDIRPGASGKLVPGFEAKIVDLAGNDAPEGETGNLLIRGRSVTPGYWNKPDVNSVKFDPDGWFWTGDMYSREEGYFIYQGRSDDMLKVGGIWVSPVEIENVLMEHEAVSECAVIGQDMEGLVKPFAYVVLENGWDTAEKNADDLSQKLLGYAAEKLPKFKRPWGIIFCDDLPKTATGKIQRFRLRTNKIETDRIRQ